MMTALLSVGAWAENLWTGSETLAYYGFQLTGAKSMSAGDVLTFTVSATTTDYAGIKLKTNDMTPGWAHAWHGIDFDISCRGYCQDCCHQRSG